MNLKKNELKRIISRFCSDKKVKKHLILNVLHEGKFALILSIEKWL
jgi:hypothetical protein